MHHRSIISSIALGLGLGIGTASAEADDLAPKVSPMALLDSVAVRLTGDLAEPMTPEEAAAEAGALGDYIESLRTSPGFLRRFSEFWLQRLKIDGPVDFERIDRDADGAPGGPRVTLLSTLQLGARQLKQVVIKTQDRNFKCPAGTSAAGQSLFYRINNSTDFGVVRCGCTPGDTDCICRKAVMIKPWFDPDKSAAVCPQLLDAKVCGPGLSLCYPEGGASTLRTGLLEGFSNEAGMMMAKIAADNRPWSDVLLSKAGVVNGPMSQFIKRFGDKFQGFVPGSYPARSKDPVFNRGVRDESWHWVNRGANHLGILTTLGFNRSTNGLRAKANRIFQTLLCNDFGAINAASTEPAPEGAGDLSRPPCSNCHQVLDPFMKGFRGWIPNVTNNYNYAPKAPADGIFFGAAFANLPSLATIIANDPAFDQCAVQTSFEFVMGRSMSAEERRTVSPLLLDVFRDTNRRIWPVIRKTLELDAYKHHIDVGG